MTIDDIKALIASDESRTLELKKTTGELKDGMHAACAFLNTEGGWLIFGIAPKSLKIVGQQVTDDTKQELAQALAGLEPACDITPIYVDVPEYPGNKVIAFHFDGWEWGQKPYTFRGRPYYKIESTTKIMPRDKSHESFPYNRNMAHALYRSTFLENWGSGIHRIIEACHEQGVEEPTWRWDGAFVYVTFKRPGKLDSHSDQAPTKYRPSIDQVPNKYRPTTAQVRKLILSMNEEYMTMSELMECVGLKHRPTFRENYFLPAIKDGAIELMYPDAPNHPKQKYRLSEVAKEWKEFNFKS